MPEKNADAIALIEKWLADESSYDERVYPILKSRLEERNTFLAQRDRLLEVCQHALFAFDCCGCSPDLADELQAAIAEVEQAE